MFCDAQSGKCKDTEKIWGIYNPSTNRLHRLTFSRSLAQMLIKDKPELQAKQFAFKIGERLEAGQTSRSGLYALMSRKGDYALRISLIKDIAQLHLDSETRYLAEAWLLED